MVATTSEIARRPPGFNTRKASANTCALSGDKLTTQLEMITSTDWSATGKCSISPRRNSTFLYPPFALFCRALLIIAGVISTPMTRPLPPTDFAAKKQSKPPPLPKSSTVSPGFNAAMAWGLPQPNPMFAPAGTAPISSAEYPSFWETSSAIAAPPSSEQQDGEQLPLESDSATFP